MPGTRFLNFCLSTVTFNLQHLELLSYTQIESYSFFSSVRRTEPLLAKTGRQGSGCESPFQPFPVCFPSYVNPCLSVSGAILRQLTVLKDLFTFFLVRKRKCLAHLS